MGKSGGRVRRYERERDGCQRYETPWGDRERRWRGRRHGEETSPLRRRRSSLGENRRLNPMTSDGRRGTASRS
ncbi:hypothetical protein BE221DRAFT_194387 [Ostreococcus tauri]|uniref:Uncharacterized protein n=1 Tax=Ostreococcus tauri TaxID=70448 RepID=A0A1Y5I1Z6_OSTTA|nr:hypothetical protein BE221DRAFT_194387 [Ostreococcus tauri]